MSETDGIEEAFEGQLRVLVTAASQIGERVARGREAALRTAQAHSEQEARELQARFAAERQVARAQLSRVHDSQWWDNAKPEDISFAWQTAKAWSGEEPEAVRAEQRIAQELQSRHGMTPEGLYSEAETERRRGVAEAAEGQRLIQQADRQEQAGDKTARQAETDVGGLRARFPLDDEPEPVEWGRAQATAEAEARKRAATATQQDSQNVYDSAERRNTTAHDLEANGIDSEVVAARMRADVSHAKPATEAVTTGSTRKSPKAKQKGRGPQSQRAELGR